jgi:hypothetical protein
MGKTQDPVPDSGRIVVLSQQSEGK